MESENKYLSRKFMLSAGIQSFSSVALAWGWLTAEIYGEISVANIVAYSFANAAVFFTRGKVNEHALGYQSAVGGVRRPCDTCGGTGVSEP